MQKKDKTSLHEKLWEAVKSVFKEHKSELTPKMEKSVKKPIRKIVKRTDKQIKKVIK